MLTVPRKSKFESLKKLIHRRTVKSQLAIPGYFLLWLGMEPETFEETAVEFGLKCFSYVSNIGVLNLCSEPPLEHASIQLSDIQLGVLSEAVVYATCVQFDVLPSELTGMHAPLQRRWQALVKAEYQRIRKLFEDNRPDVVLLLQGFEPQNAIARIAALELGIEILAVENTALENRFVWDRVSGLTNHNAAHQIYWRNKGRFASHVYQEYCQQLISDTKRLKCGDHTSPEHDAESSLSSDLVKPYVLFLGQVYTDSSQVFGLRQWSSPLEVLRSCVRWCRQHDLDLILKLHPKESSGVNPVDGRPYDKLTYRKIMADAELAEGLQQMNAVIDFDNQYDTYKLIDDASLAVTVNSQSGLEAAIRGVPVVVCGNASFGGLDFTFDAPQAEFFAPAMKAAIRSGKAHDSPATAVPRTNLACEFAYIFFEHYCRVKTPQGLLQLVQEVMP